MKLFEHNIGAFNKQFEQQIDISARFVRRAGDCYRFEHSAELYIKLKLSSSIVKNIQIVLDNFNIENIHSFEEFKDHDNEQLLNWLKSDLPFDVTRQKIKSIDFHKIKYRVRHDLENENILDEAINESISAAIVDFFNDYNVEKLIDKSLTRYKQKMTLIDLNSNFQF
jgi:hypothetical protein